MSAFDARPVVSIRERTSDDPETFAVQRLPMPRYLLFTPARPEKYLTVFGLVQGGDTREEAVFWAERWASKQDYRFERPEGWEDVKGALPKPSEDAIRARTEEWDVGPRPGDDSVIVPSSERPKEESDGA